MDVATMTTDFAMQNVLLQLNLKLLSTNMQRVKHVNTKVLRCHACFNIVKQMDKQFCPRCGQSTLQRVSCSTNAKGEFKIHLARNYQYNKRGDKYSIPKPIAGTANSKWSGQGGGKGGWGRDLILAEDQKEYQKQVTDGQRHQTRDLMDADYLPGILTGDRGRAGGRVKVGAGKNVNAKKRT
jgi:RNA-binding protein NOB1